MNITVDNLLNKIKIYANSIGTRVENDDIFEFATSAIRELRAGRKIAQTKRKTTKEIYTNIFKYQMPTDFGQMIKPNEPLRAKEDEGTFRIFSSAKEFRANSQIGLAVDQERDSTFLLARINGNSDLSIDNFSASDVSDYTITGDGSGAIQDDVIYREGSSCLRFNITDSTGQTIISRTLDTTIDITDYLTVGKVFLKVYLPEAITSLAIRLLSSTGNYYEITGVSTQNTGEDLEEGWNTIEFDMANATETGSPDEDNIASFEVELNHSGVSGIFRLDAFSLKLGTEIEIPYYSKYAIQESSGSDTYQEKIDSTTNIILFDETFEDLIAWKTLELTAFLKYRDADLVEYCKAKREEMEPDFNNMYPQEQALNQVQYYRRANKF